MAHDRDQYAALSDRDLVETAKNALQSSLAAMNQDSREERMVIHDAAVHELKLRLFEHVAASGAGCAGRDPGRRPGQRQPRPVAARLC